jgi:large subunit ribosomal protein L10
MSKQIKQLEMDALEQTFREVRDLVFLSVSGVNAQLDNQVRLALRKKDIRLQVVKNSLASRVLKRLGMQIRDRHKEEGEKKTKVRGTFWEGPTTLAWGGSSIAELSRTLKEALGRNEKVKFKGAVADGEELTFDQALTRPTREEAIGRVVMLALSPASRIAGALRGPAGRVAGQVKSLSEKTEEASAGAPAEAPPA